MPSAGLAALAQILGQSFAGLPKGMAEAEDMQMKEQDRALREKAFGLQERTFGLQERADQRAEAAQFTDVPGIGRLPTALAGVAFGDQLRRQTEERERGRVRQERRQFADAYGHLATRPETLTDISDPRLGETPQNVTMDVPDRGMLGAAETDPGFKALESLVLSKLKPAEYQAVSTEQDLYEKPTSAGQAPRLIRPGTPKVHEPKEGERRAAEIHNYLVNVRRLTPGTPQYETEFMNWRNRPLTIFPGGEGFKMTDFMGGAGAPSNPGQAPAAPRPTVKVAPNEPAVGTEQATNLADFRTLLEQMDKVEKLYKEGASQYVGPVTGRLGAARTVTGVGATEGEADFRSELASIQNSIIYLKSGKQINEAEYERLKRELPDPNDPDPVFTAKLRRSRTLLGAMLANREAEFKARGYRGTSPPNAGGNAPPPAKPGVETLSRRDPRYRQARDRGLTDQQIEQRFGIRLVWD